MKKKLAVVTAAAFGAIALLVGVAAATPNANAVGSMNIAVNDNVVINESNLTFSNTNQGYYYYVVVFN